MDEFMQAALDEAKQGLVESGISIDSVLVIDGQIVGRGQIGGSYGHRLSTPKQTAALLRKFGMFLKERCQGTIAYIYVRKEALLKHILLWPPWKKPLDNGGLHRYLAKYKIR